MLSEPLEHNSGNSQERGSYRLGRRWKPGEPHFTTPSGKLEFVSTTERHQSSRATGVGRTSGYPEPNRSAFIQAHTRQTGSSDSCKDRESELPQRDHHNERFGQGLDSSGTSQGPWNPDGECMTISSPSAREGPGPRSPKAYIPIAFSCRAVTAFFQKSCKPRSDTGCLTTTSFRLTLSRSLDTTCPLK